MQSDDQLQPTVDLCQVNGKWLFAVDAPTFGKAALDLEKPAAPTATGKLGLLCSDMHQIMARGDSTLVAQFYELVVPGTILTKHVFLGLQRPLRTDGNSSADREMLVYTRKPAYDAVWVGGRDGHVKRVDAPAGCVLTVIVRPNYGKHHAEFPEIDGWINHWAWVEEDEALSGASKQWVDRYIMKLWTRAEGA